jgi:hypothetical protein
MLTNHWLSNQKFRVNVFVGDEKITTKVVNVTLPCMGGDVRMCWDQISQQIIPFVDEQIFVRQLRTMAENQCTLIGAIYSAMPKALIAHKSASLDEIALALNMDKLAPVDPNNPNNIKDK